MNHPFDIYSKQILSFKLEGQKKHNDLWLNYDTEKIVQRNIQFAEQSDAESIILFGAGDGKLAKALADSKPAWMELIICDLYPENILKIKDYNFTSDLLNSKTHLLVDSSIWAVLLLLIQYGFTAIKSRLILNPCLEGENKKKHQSLQKLFSSHKSIQIPDNQNSNIKISAAAIVSPNEPDLDSFISSFPSWIYELVLVWDCNDYSQLPVITCESDLKIVNVCNPLSNNFGAQRNVMLEHCQGDWVIYLDADERLTIKDWDLLKKIASYDKCDYWYFPRLTFYPDKDHCRIGFGLWPDLQLRFFRKSPKIRFIKNIHEQITGLKGYTGIIAGSPISHLTHLIKNRDEIESKLTNFNNAAGGKITHKLNHELPTLDSKLIKPQEDVPLLPIILPPIII
ncbi:glycosyltransferase [Desulfovibrio sp. UCD-KL4C]|uniref:glycosyltransferase n=1 Tax=Desulfovibrio sp. UCD-KL4C TaxID=2578120 RepID=UPI0025BC4A1E|nr:glycosyltransferase [Desulfovibrio sp. UCD-KL4C]